MKGLLTSKSTISTQNTSIARLKLISGHMVVNLAKISLPGNEWTANKIGNNLDGCLILDLEPRKVMESLCYK